MEITESDVSIPHTRGRIKYKDYRRDDAIDDGWDSYVIGDRYMSTGASCLFFETTGVNTVFMCGLINPEKIDPAMDKIALNQFDYCYFLGGPGEYVQLSYVDENGDGDILDTGVRAVNGYRWRIMLSEGNINFSYSDRTNQLAPGPWVNIITVNYGNDKDNLDFGLYYPALGIYTKNNAGNQGTIRKFAYYPDPYHYIDDNKKEYQETVDNIIYDFGLDAKIASKVSIDFLGNQKLYGFDDEILETKNAITKYKWVGDDAVDDVHLPNNLNVILKNMQIEGYDSFSGDRSDILMTIPTIDYEGSRIAFETSTPIYIDMSNKTIMNLNQIRIELKEFNGKYLKLLPDTCDLTILIRDNPNDQ
jgi:hypothetical protein